MSEFLTSAGGRAASALLTTVVIAAGLILVAGDAAYLWIKAIHVVAVIAWMAGLLYLPRLFVYHTQVAVGSESSELFKVMERRLLTIIMTPAMIIAWGLGLWLAYAGGYFSDIWFLAKLVAVALMSAAHGHLSASVRRFAADENTKTERYWRMINEVPTVLMFAIVILVIVKPF